MVSRPAFDIDPRLERESAGRRFADAGRVDIADVLSEPSALAARRMLEEGAVWGIRYGRGDHRRYLLPGRILADKPAASVAAIDTMLATRLGAPGAYTFISAVHDYAPVGAVEAAPDVLGQHVSAQMNSAPMIDLVRTVTGISSIRRASANITLFRPGHFLPIHTDEMDGRTIAYVLHLGLTDWRDEWGGQLLFHRHDDGIVDAFPTAFNHLMLFDILQPHSVSPVAPGAPAGRIAVSGWFYENDPVPDPSTGPGD